MWRMNRTRRAMVVATTVVVVPLMVIVRHDAGFLSAQLMGTFRVGDPSGLCQVLRATHIVASVILTSVSVT